MNAHSTATLHKLADTGETVDGSANDVRGREVKDSDGETLGRVEDLLIDEGERKVRFLVVVAGGGVLGIGRTRAFIPVDAITSITDTEVLIGHSRAQVATAPTYDPDIVDDRAHQSSVCGHYGYLPYWGPDYAYPHGRSTSPILPRETF